MDKNVKPRSGLLNVREKNGKDRRWWSPDRDITTVYPRIMQCVFHKLSAALDETNTDYSPVAASIKDALYVDESDLAKLAGVYAKMISCVQARKSVSETLEAAHFYEQPGHAVIGELFLEELTRLFVSKYKDTLHKGQEDENEDMLADLRELLQNMSHVDSKE